MEHYYDLKYYIDIGIKYILYLVDCEILRKSYSDVVIEFEKREYRYRNSYHICRVYLILYSRNPRPRYTLRYRGYNIRYTYNQ